jgi:hypothetical protein
MPGGTNGPAVLNTSAFVYPEVSLADLRQQLLIRLGYAAQLASPPPGLNLTLDSFLRSAQALIFKQYKRFRQQKWFSVALTTGNRFYDIPYDGAFYGGRDVAIINGTPDSITGGNADFTAAGFTTGMTIDIWGSDADDGAHVVGASVGTSSMELQSSAVVTGELAGSQIMVAERGWYALDPRSIQEVVLLDDTIWGPMREGIDPILFNIDPSQQRPTNYEIREFIEVYPEPEKAYTLYIKGHIMPRPFTADDHHASVDPDALLALALANGKAHFGQSDARVYFDQYREIIGDDNSDQTNRKRYIPGAKGDERMPMAKPVGTWRP